MAYFIARQSALKSQPEWLQQSKKWMDNECVSRTFHFLVVAKLEIFYGHLIF